MEPPPLPDDPDDDPDPGGTLVPSGTAPAFPTPSAQPGANPGSTGGERPPFAQSLRRWRRRKDLSQGEAAALLGYSRNYWVRLEQGDRPPTPELLERLAEHAGPCAPTLLAVGRWALEGGVGQAPPMADPGAPIPAPAEPAAPPRRGSWAPPPPPYPPYPGYPSYPPPFPPYPAYPAYPRYPAYPPRWATRRHRPRPPKRRR